MGRRWDHVLLWVRTEYVDVVWRGVGDGSYYCSVFWWIASTILTISTSFIHLRKGCPDRRKSHLVLCLHVHTMSWEISRTWRNTLYYGSIEGSQGREGLYSRLPKGRLLLAPQSSPSQNIPCLYHTLLCIDLSFVKGLDMFQRFCNILTILLLAVCLT